MTLSQQTQALRARLGAWAAAPEWKLLARYELLPQRPSPVWHKRLSRRVGRLLRVLGLSRARYRAQTWRPGLKHAAAPQGPTLLLWSDMADTAASRSACAGIQRLLAAHPDYTPVLVTDLADFAFYSRLGWLVEYLPDIPGHGPSYGERKQRYLAWRYRHAVALPLAVGLAEQKEFDALIAGE